MRLNSDTVLSIPKSPLVLVPYCEQHVKRYHDWMQDARLLELTGSERLTLSEEWENMRSWREDEMKLTFILLDTSRSATFMVGDVNLHVLENEDGEENGGKRVGELEVMIAESSCRRQGFAQTALELIMAFAEKHLEIEVFMAKILEDNSGSVALFTEKLRFRELRRVRAFHEVHMVREVDAELSRELGSVRGRWRVGRFRGGVHDAGREEAGEGKGNGVGCV